jgi:putative transposase
MPRRARLEVPGIPLHIVQRGVNRGAVFVDNEDRHHYLDLLNKVAVDYEVAVHAYVLMGNHVHLLMTSDEAGAISMAMRRLGQCYAQAFNRKYRRTGPLWEGRFKSCLVESDRYLLTVYRYIELNPVRAALAATPERYRWSSVHGNLGLLSDSLLSPHPVFLGLGADILSRGHAYRHWLVQGTDPDDLRIIRDYVSQERALGSPRFQSMVEKMLGHCVGFRPRGRPARDRSA